MQPYGNLKGNSGVSHFACGDHFIRVQFRGSPRIYLYTYEQPGRQHVEQMKTLARSGRALSTYISRHVHDAYAAIEYPRGEPPDNSTWR